MIGKSQHDLFSLSPLLQALAPERNEVSRTGQVNETAAVQNKQMAELMSCSIPG